MTQRDNHYIHSNPLHRTMIAIDQLDTARSLPLDNTTLRGIHSEPPASTRSLRLLNSTLAVLIGAATIPLDRTESRYRISVAGSTPLFMERNKTHEITQHFISWCSRIIKSGKKYARLTRTVVARRTHHVACRPRRGRIVEAASTNQTLATTCSTVSASRTR